MKLCLRRALLVFGLAGLILAAFVCSLQSLPPSCPAPSPGPGDGARLASQVTRVHNAPAGSVVQLTFSAAELERYSNDELLPELSLSVLAVRAHLSGDTLVTTACLGAGTSVGSVTLAGARTDPAHLRFTEAHVLGLRLPGWALRVAERIANDSLATGEWGFTPLGLTFGQGEAQLTVIRR